ncbi:MAG TPA: hypothetical protein VE177_06230, partial [Candidatus Binatus sp.]|nr:hypothetical protein [Candidatus Binatus sp.]
NSFFRASSASISLVSSFFRGRSIHLGASLGSSSGFVEKASFFRSLVGSLGSSLSVAEGLSLFRSLSDSLAMNLLGGRDTFHLENLRVNLSTGGAVSGHYECGVNAFFNCGAVTASFELLVIIIIAVVALVFGTYATRQYWHSPLHEEVKEKPEYFGDGSEKVKVVEDEEGWETKAFDDKEGQEKKDEDAD